jgi:L-asparaginase II
MSASHGSEAHHISRARSMLSLSGATEADMQCGGHPALNPNVNKAWIQADFTPGAIENNCSGKHAGMLAGAKALGAGFADYHSPAHPMQKAVKRVVQETSRADPDDILWAVDGCNLPAPAMPLTSMGAMYACFASSVERATTPRERAMKRVFKAMSAHPEMVGGEKRFCTELMRRYGGLLIGKVGADGCYGVGIRECEDTRRLGASESGVGIAVKIESGSMDLVYAAVAEILVQLQIGSADARSALQGWRAPEIFNTMGVITGVTMHCFEVRKQA